MVHIIKDSSVPMLQKKLTAIYILNVTDILFTRLLLKTNLFSEANILMHTIVSHPLLSILVKIILPALLIIYTFPKLYELKHANLKSCNFGILLILLLYININILHIIYTFLFISLLI